MSDVYNNSLKFNYEQKSLRIPIETQNPDLKKNISINNPKEFYTTKMNKHIACGYSLFRHCSFESNKNKHDSYKGKDPMREQEKNYKN